MEIVQAYGKVLVLRDRKYNLWVFDTDVFNPDTKATNINLWPN